MSDPRMSERTSYVILITALAVGLLVGIVVAVLTEFWLAILVGLMVGYFTAYNVVQESDMRRWRDAIKRGESPWEDAT